MLIRKGKWWIITDAEGTEVERCRVRPAPALSIEEIVSGMDHQDDSQWTRSGKPSMAYIEELLGDSSITRQDVDKATGGMKRGQ